MMPTLECKRRSDNVPRRRLDSLNVAVENRVCPRSLLRAVTETVDAALSWRLPPERCSSIRILRMEDV